MEFIDEKIKGYSIVDLEKKKSFQSSTSGAFVVKGTGSITGPANCVLEQVFEYLVVQSRFFFPFGWTNEQWDRVNGRPECVVECLLNSIFPVFPVVSSSFRAVLEQFQSSFRTISEDFQNSNRAVSEQFKSSFRAVSEQFKSSFRAVSEQFKSSFRLISGQFSSSVSAVSEQCQCSFRAVSEQFQSSFRAVLTLKPFSLLNVLILFNH